MPVVPLPDPSGLPAPHLVLKALLLLTFSLHLIAMNLLVGGTVMFGVAYLRRADGFYDRLRRGLATSLPVVMSLTVSLGVAPLLFVQVLYGQAFYTSSILMAWPWLAIIPLLMMGYYGLYIAQMAPPWSRRWIGALPWLCSSMFLVIAFLFSRNWSLMLHPELWDGIYHAASRGTHLGASDGSAWPRYLHFVLAAPANAGIALVLTASLFGRGDPAWQERARGYGARWFLSAAGASVIVGGWYLFALPDGVAKAFMGRSRFDSLVLAAGIVTGIASMPLVRRRPGAAAVLVLATVGLMVAVRHRVRELMLQPDVAVASIPVHPQWKALALFVVVLLIGLAVIVWMGAKLLRGRPADVASSDD